MWSCDNWQEYETQICVFLSTDEVDVLPGNTVLDWITDAFKWRLR